MRTQQKEIAEIVRECGELPVPPGNARRRKGFTHRFVAAKNVGPLVAALCREYGTEMEIRHKPFAVPCIVWRYPSDRYGWPGTSQVVLWLPGGEDFCVVSA